MMEKTKLLEQIALKRKNQLLSQIQDTLKHFNELPSY